MSGTKTSASGFHGVHQHGEHYVASIDMDQMKEYIGTYDYAKEAALAFDRVATAKYNRPRSQLNFPDGLPIDDEDYDAIMNPKIKQRLRSSTSNSYCGVTKVGERFVAQIYANQQTQGLGTYDTPMEAALAFDRAVIHHRLSTSNLNFPNDYYDDVIRTKKRNRPSPNTTAYKGVYKSNNRFQAMIGVGGKTNYLGSYDTAKEAAVAYDRVAIHYLFPSSAKLNFPDGLPIDDENYDETMKPTKKRRLASRNTTGFTGVVKNRKRFKAQIYFDGKTKNLGTYGTAKEAALAYDRAVVQHKLPSSKLNFPNDYTTGSEDDESSDIDDDESDDVATTPTTIKEEPEAELILNKAEEEEEIHVKSEPEAEF